MQMYQCSLNLSSLQQKFSFMSCYLGTNTFVAKRVDCILVPVGSNVCCEMAGSICYQANSDGLFVRGL